MHDEFLAFVKKSLLKAGLSAASEISSRSPSLGFGDAESIWELGNLRIKFIKDRGQIFVDLGSKFNESTFFIFDDVSLLLKWQELDDIMNTDVPLDVESSLNLVKQDPNKLNALFYKDAIQKTSDEIEQISELKAQVRFG